MNIEQYESLRQRPGESEAVIRHDDFTDSVPAEQTLLWGYTCDRNSFHVYKSQGELHRVVYNFSKEVLEYDHGKELPARILHPDKRVYPEATCYEFIEALRAVGEQPSLTTFNKDRERSLWYGDRYEDLTDLRPVWNR